MKNKQLHKEFNTAVEEIKQISMTDVEKSNMLEHILKGSTFVECPIESPYVKYSFASVLSKRNIFYFSSVMCLVVMLSGGTVFASGKSLPGSILYPLKVKVIEPTQGALIFREEDKVAYQSNLITKRFIEAEALASANNLDSDKEDQISLLIEGHAKAFTKAVTTLRATNSIDNDTDDDIVINFQAQINAHAEVLDAIYAEQSNVKEKQNVKISQTARDNAVKVRSDLKNKQTNTEAKSKKTKDIVQSLIDKTNMDISVAGVGASAKQQLIITNTNKNLDQARALLKEVEDEDKKGNSEDAHQKLLDSESAAKTASILLNLGLGVGNK